MVIVFSFLHLFTGIIAKNIQKAHIKFIFIYIVDQKELKAQIKDARDAGEAKKEKYKILYSMDGVVNAKQGSGDDASKQNQLAVSKWVGNDPGKQAFIQLSAQKGQLDLNNNSPEFLDKVYQAYQTELKNQSLEKAARESAIKRPN